MNLHYNNVVSGLSNTAQYNGNISAIQYSNHLGQADVKQRAYAFSYDAMNRLTDANPREMTGSQWAATQAYAEHGLTYDRNGNILSLQRKGAGGTVMDNMTYSYGSTDIAKANRLLTVTDAGDKAQGFVDGNRAGDDYTYDVNGNMTVDKNKDVTAITYNHLNLPSQVTKKSGDYIKYIYDATGRKLSQLVYAPGSVLKKKTDYASEFFYENDTLKFINHEEGRIVMTSPSGGTTPEYQYHLKDHLGNVRTTFTTKTDVETATATLETANAVGEQSKFLYYDEAVKINTTIFDHTNLGGTFYSTRLNGTANERTGLAKSLSVMPGDTIKAEVFVKYLDTNSNNWQANLTNLFTSIANGTAPAGTWIDGGLAGSTGGATAPYLTLLNKTNETGSAPKAFLNYLIFDRNYVKLDGGFVRMSDVAKENGTDVAHEKLAAQFVIKEPGYVYIYISNDNLALGGQMIETYWDDFKVTQTKSPVIQTEEYYPFGAISSSSQRENSLENKRLYQGKEYQGDLGLNLYDIHWRQYDPWAPHTTTMDPHAENYYNFSPYSWALNNPVNYTDPDGKDVIFDISRNKKGEITGVSLRATVYITGEGASSERAGELNDMASRILRPGTSKNGVSISFNVSFKYSKDISAKDLKAGENILTFSSERAKTSRDDKTGKTSHVNASYSRTVDPKTRTASYEQFSGRTGIMYGDERLSHVNILHETLHFLGLSDRYDNEQVGKPDQGYENDIMGTRGSTNIGNAHYDNYGNYIRSINPTGSSYLNKKTVDKDSRGLVISPTKKELEKK